MADETMDLAGDNEVAMLIQALAKNKKKAPYQMPTISGNAPGEASLMAAAAQSPYAIGYLDLLMNRNDAANLNSITQAQLFGDMNARAMAGQADQEAKLAQQEAILKYAKDLSGILGNQATSEMLAGAGYAIPESSLAQLLDRTGVAVDTAQAGNNFIDAGIDVRKSLLENILNDIQLPGTTRTPSSEISSGNMANAMRSTTTNKVKATTQIGTDASGQPIYGFIETDVKGVGLPGVITHQPGMIGGKGSGGGGSTGVDAKMQKLQAAFGAKNVEKTSRGYLVTGKDGKTKLVRE